VTDLFVFGGTPPVPPPCRREPAALPPWTRTGADTAALELPWLEPRAPAAQVLPSLSLLADADYSFRFEAQTIDAAGWTALSPVGRDEFPPAGEPDRRLRADIDVFAASTPVPRVRLRVRLQAADLEPLRRAPALVTVSLSDGAPAGVDSRAGRARLDVPPLSQMELPEAMRHRVCSPASVAMVLGYWKRPVPVADLAASMYDARHDLYGVWPAAIRAAARHGVAGYLLRFPSWAAAAWCLDRGLPIIASVHYAAGELRGAAIESTKGHLLVLAGYEGEHVLANDPAAPTSREVPRAYALDDIRRVWLERTGVGYVLFSGEVHA